MVIGIIAVLISILMPALRRARESARSIQCANSVRMIMVGVIGYTNENKGALPAAPTFNEVYPGPPNYAAYYFKASGSRDIEFKYGAIMKFIGPPGVRPMMMRCPDAADNTANYSYPFNDELTVITHGFRMSQIRRPWTKILIFEQDAPDDGHFNLGGLDQPSIHHFRVGRTFGYGNYGFADGHVESLAPRILLTHLDWSELWK